MKDKIKIDKYEARLVKGKVITYAIKGDKEYQIPEAFVNMCDDNHLMITKAKTVMPELFGTNGDYYVPLRTDC